MSLASLYARAVFDDLGAQATWHPDQRLRVGDIVERNRAGMLTVTTQISALWKGSLPKVVRHPAAKKVELQRGAKFTVSGDADALMAGATLTFSGASSFIFSAADSSIETFAERAPVREAIMDLDRRAVWQRRWQLVTTVRHFRSYTLVIASGAGVTAHVTATAQPSVPGFPNLQAGSGLTITSGKASTWRGTKGTPMYESLVVHVPVFGNAEIKSHDHYSYLQQPSAPIILVRDEPLYVGPPGVAALELPD